MTVVPTRKTNNSRIAYDPLPLTQEDWGKICSLPWKKQARRIIGELFKREGFAFGDEIFAEGGSMNHVNTVFIKAGVPYRLRADYDRRRPAKDGWDSPYMQSLYELRRTLN